MKSPASQANKYDRLLAAVFKRKWNSSLTEVPFTKDEVIDAAGELGLRLKNLADVTYTSWTRRWR